MPALPLVKINFPPSFLLTFKSLLNTTSSINFPWSLLVGIHLFPLPPSDSLDLGSFHSGSCAFCLVLWFPVGMSVSPPRLGAPASQEPTLDLVFDFSLGNSSRPYISHMISKCLLNHKELNQTMQPVPSRSFQSSQGTEEKRRKITDYVSISRSVPHRPGVLAASASFHPLNLPSGLCTLCIST